MTDHAKRQAYLEIAKAEGCPNKLAVSLMFFALFAPFVTCILFL